MALWRRKRKPEAPEPRPSGPPPEEIVGLYLRAQNLEQVRRVDEAVPMYEQAVAAGFDAAGPYDRLIAIYRAREAHAEVQRVASEALRWVRTFDDKRAWYEAMRSGAEQAARQRPDPRGAEFSFETGGKTAPPVDPPSAASPPPFRER